MKISLNWLQDFVKLTVTDPQEIGRRVTAGVAEVDEVEVQGEFLENCCVGKVLSLKKHPNADRLNVCEVQTDAGVKPVVCGGTNLRVGMRVALAHIGAKVRWHGGEIATIERAKIRGEDSQGMICAAEEIGLQAKFPPKPSEGERAIVDLGNGDEGVGRSLRDYLGQNDVVLHIDNHAITHRADLFSHVGFAREFVALGLATWKGKPGERKGGKTLKFPKTSLPMKCIVDCKDLVPRYSSCIIDIDGLGETPVWMRHRLEATGWRCVSLPVDITNYVAMETGMPLHSFDADDIRGDFHIRVTREGESITTLDDVKRPLPPGAIVLSDKDGIFDLLGIMGGLRSSTKESTKHIYLHAAIADAASIRKAIIATGHRTDASTVYEKGIPREAAGRGILRAIELFLELVPGARLASKLEEWGDEGKAKAISLPVAQVNKVLGTDVAVPKMKKILADLEFGVKAGAKGTLTVTPPLHRLGDVRGPLDLIEEIGRVVGYNEIPAVLPAARIAPPKRDPRLYGLREALRQERCIEIMPLSLMSEALIRSCGLDTATAVAIKNPLGEELKWMQPSVLPGLLDHAQRNVRLADTELRTFTFSRVFSRNAPERTEMGILFANLERLDDPRALLREPFLQLRSSLDYALRTLGYQLDIAVAGAVGAYAHPGRFAELHVRAASPDAAGQPYAGIGMIFELHPTVATRFDLPHRAACALLDLSALLRLPRVAAIAAPVPQFPAVSYDVTETFRHTRSVGELLRQLRGSHENLESVMVKDLYAGPDLPRDSYNLTLTFTYRAKDRTLTEDEAKAIHTKVSEALVRTGE